MIGKYTGLNSAESNAHISLRAISVSFALFCPFFFPFLHFFFRNGSHG